jgi:ABC-2 type transport system permease protein
MNQVMTIAKREVMALFYSPIAYVVMFLFLLLEGILFSLLVFEPGRLTELRQLVGASQFGLFFIVPLLTMSMFADEYHSGRMEMLRTSPITEVRLLLGKFLGTMGFYVVLLALTLVYLGLLIIFGRLDWGQTACCYLGLVLLGMLFVSVGLFYSACTQNQIVAALASLLTLGLLTFAEPLSSVLPSAWKIWKIEIPARASLRYIGVGTHLEDFSKGVLDTGHGAFFVMFTLLFLFLTYLVLESKKWR